MGSEVTFPRRERERATIAAMLQMYCRAHHRSKDKALCPACALLDGYAAQRLERCRFGEAKPACAKCPVHCYKADMRTQVRQVMRWAGPRMLWRHPLMAIRHLIDGRTAAPAVFPPR
jgi:hypothetical protein